MPQITASILIIGNEILSGRTQDINIQFIAKNLLKIGIILKEVRVVADVRDQIVNNLNKLRTSYNYVFTTGGIGPTHDDITSECVSIVFDRKHIINDDYESLIDVNNIKFREDTTNLLNRTLDFIKEIINRHSKLKDTVLIVTHMAVINTIKFIFDEKTDINDEFSVGNIEIVKIRKNLL